MANFFPTILFLGLCISIHVQARESQFFSKFTANADGNNDVEDTKSETMMTRVGSSKEQAEFLKKQAQDPPSFVAENKNGYGLYGHETGQLPAATTTSFADEPYYNKEKNYDGFYDKNTFANDEEIARDTKAMLQGRSYTTAAAKDIYGNEVENARNNNYFPPEEQGARLQASSYSTGTAAAGNYGSAAVNGQNNYYARGNRYAANGNKVQQHGMSDTRFLENGKYYYNIDNEEKYDPSRYAESRNTEFESQGYLPSANRNNYEFINRKNNNYNGNYYADNYAAENAKVMAGGYDPLKNQYVFRGTKNDEEFTP